MFHNTSFLFDKALYLLTVFNIHHTFAVDFSD